MKSVDVVAAIIAQDKKILATQRGYGSFKGYWEFPGGKIEAGESPCEALVREISEELDVSVKVGSLISEIDYDYPDFHLHMRCFACTLAEGQSPTLLEHDDARWLSRETIHAVEWLPADISVIDDIKASTLI